MPKVTAEFMKSVLVEIRGEKQPNAATHTLPDDGGLSLRFLRWCIDNKIQHVRVMSAGPGHCTGIYLEKDIERIRQFLEGEGVELSPVYDDIEDEPDDAASVGT